MLIEIFRDIKLSTKKSTAGIMRINSIFECFTLEDCDREVEGDPVGSWKVAGATCIPKGTYKVVIDFSNRFQKLMPHILDVKGFEGIRIHSGNTDADCEGCVLLGRTRAINFIGKSKLAFDAFYKKLEKAINNKEQVTLTIKDIITR